MFIIGPSILYMFSESFAKDCSIPKTLNQGFKDFKDFNWDFKIS